MNEDKPPKPVTASNLVLLLRILIYSALVLLVLVVGFFPIVSAAKLSLNMMHSSTTGH